MNSRIKGDTKIFSSIGDPVNHSLSPQIHNSIFDLNNLNNVHIPIRITEENLEKYILMLRNNFTGLSVTKPHKQSIIPFLDQIDEEAKRYNAVNTIKIKDGLMIGYNTDGYGFVRSLELNNIDINNKDILLIGAGGAAGVLSFEILRLGGNLTISNRTIEKAENLKADLSKYWSQNKINVCKIEELKYGYFGIVNATPVGMFPNINEMPISENVLQNTNFVFDLIYNPSSTKLLQCARNYGCNCINGFSMLFYQAVKAQEIWTGSKSDEEALISIKCEIENCFNMENH